LRLSNEINNVQFSGDFCCARVTTKVNHANSSLY